MTETRVCADDSQGLEKRKGRVQLPRKFSMRDQSQSSKIPSGGRKQQETAVFIRLKSLIFAMLGTITIFTSVSFPFGSGVNVSQRLAVMPTGCKSCSPSLSAYDVLTLWTDKQHQTTQAAWFCSQVRRLTIHTHVVCSHKEQRTSSLYTPRWPQCVQCGRRLVYIVYMFKSVGDLALSGANQSSVCLVWQ